jgi:hypothetical protein
VIIASIDPGKVSGVAVTEFIDLTGRYDALTARDTRLIHSSEIEFPQMLDWCEETFPQVDHVVVENFFITPQTGKNSQAPWSLMGIGVAVSMAMRCGKGYTLQKPADALNFTSSDLLHSLQLWHRGGAGHANDALRHAVLYAVRKGWRSPSLINFDKS